MCLQRSPSSPGARAEKLLRAAASLLLVVASLAPPAALAEIQYVYDENGRLVQVIDTAGTSAQYSYDAAGNIVTINQVSATTLSIVEFTANAGPVGATVQIHGTGFSTTPISNAVAFNGTSATVSSSTANRLVVAVPSGATTGKITVVVSGITATSAQDFTVNSGIPMPTITGFTPTIGTVGTAITVNGANFDGNVANNKLRFNGTTAAIASVTATQLGSKVPVFATSGRMSVVTPYGNAISSGDFFVPPGSYTAADVGFTGRTTVGAAPAAVTLAATAKVAMLLFDGTKGQQLGLGVSNVVFSPSSSAHVYVKQPNGDDLITGVYFGPAGQGMSLPTLPATGTYTILIVPNTATNMSLLVSLSQDVTGTIVPGGSPVTVATTFAGQRANLIFQGTLGKRVSLRISGVTLSGGISMEVSILKPDGTTLAIDTWVSGPDFIDVQSLPVDGSYTILVDPAYAATVTATLTLYDVPADSTGTITAGGASVPVSTTVPGQSADRTFSGTLGQRISLAVTGVTLTGGTSNIGSVTIFNPDGTTLASLCCVSALDFIDAQTLPASGTYKIQFHPRNGAAGSATLKLYDVPPDVTGTIAPGGAPITVTTTVAGQNADLTFSGTQGQRISLGITGVSLTDAIPSYATYASVLIIKPDGTTLASASPVSTWGFIDTRTLPATGTYTVRFDPANTSVGSGTLTLYDVPPDITGPIAAGGPAVPVTTTVAGQKADLIFTGTQGQRISLAVSGVTLTGGVSSNVATVSIIKPDGITLASVGNVSSSAFINLQILPAAGTYTVRFDPTAMSYGSGTLTLYDVPPDATGTLTIGGAGVLLTTTVPGQNALATFNGTAGQQVTGHITGNTFAGTTYVYLRKPDNSNLTSTASSAANFNLATQTLPTAGVYTIFVDPSGDTTGSVTVNVTSP